MVKVITRMGLMLMEPEERDERLERLMTDNVIHCDLVGELIDACRDKCYELSRGDSQAVSEQQKIQIRWMLSRINGADMAHSMDPEELIDWVIDLRENKTEFSKSELASVGRAIMMRE